MTYNKPEVFLLGDASRIIGGGKDDGLPLDGYAHAIPGYELDE